MVVSFKNAGLDGLYEKHGSQWKSYAINESRV